MSITYRNVADATLFVELDRGALVRVDPGDVIVVSDAEASPRYFQTGDTGEAPLWELVATKPATTKKAAPAAEGE